MTPAELTAFRGGDGDIFRRLVDEHSPRLLAVAFGITGSLDEAHDVVQEVWVKAFQGRHQLHTPGALTGWLLTTCRNVGRSELRRAAVRNRHAPDGLGAPASERPTPDAAAERAELRVDIAEAIATLPERQRDTVMLRIIEGRGTRETAELLSCAEGTVKAALHQALKKLNPLLRRWSDAVVP